MGMTKQEIIQVLGQPDSDNDCGKRGWILLYSWYEFFISRDNKLFAIQNDNYDPQNRDSYSFKNELIEIDSWFLNADDNKSLNEIAELLKSKEIKHNIDDYFGRSVIKAESGVIIDFSDEENESGLRELIGIRFWPEI